MSIGSLSRHCILLVVVGFSLLMPCYMYAVETQPPLDTTAPETDVADQTGVVDTQPETSGQAKGTDTSPWSLFFGPQTILSAAAPTYDEQGIHSITAMLGTEFHYEILPHFAVAPAVSFSITHYRGNTNRIFTTSLDHRIALTFAFVLDMPLLGIITINHWRITIGGGVALFMRAGMREMNIRGISNESIAQINHAFWAKGRFFYPSLQIRTTYTWASGWRIGFFGKVFIPIANTWANKKTENIPFYDSMIIQAGMILFFPKK